MHLLIYASPFNMACRSLRKKIRSIGAGIRCSYFPTINSLDKHLRKPLGISPVCVLIPSDSGELAALIGMRHLLRDMRIILVLADDQAGNIHMASAHMLRPRFISYADGDLSDVAAVLGKMANAVQGHQIQAVQ